MFNYLKNYLLKFEYSLIIIPILLILFWPQLISNFFNSNYMPHGHCYMWLPELVGLHVFSDFMIGAAYIAISITLALLVLKAKNDIPFHKMFLAFGIFIVTCGLTHLMAVWTLWDAIYWISGSVKLVTAVASVATAIALPFLVPRVLELIRAAKISEERKVMLEDANAELASLNDKLKELDKIKTNFFSSVSHELRTPLALILGPSQKILNSQDIPENVRKEISTIVQNGYTLLKYVNDLLDISKLEAGKLKLKYTETDLSKLLKYTTDHFNSLVKDNEIRFNLNIEENINAQIDADKINRVFLNLLSNALKFTPHNGTISCSLKTEHNNAVFIIEDSGPGIKPEHREQVFEKFEQVEESHDTRFGGTGLGLSITKEFVELHKGSVIIDRSELGGALFKATIPLFAPPDIEIRKEEYELKEDEELVKQTLSKLKSVKKIIKKEFSPAEPLAKSDSEKGENLQGRVLVVEDNEDMNNFISEALSRYYQVVSAYNGVEGLKKLELFKPDLIITDVMMPEMNGEEMIRNIRSMQEYDIIPIILLTAKADEEFKLGLLKKGAQDYLNKPFSIEELNVRSRNLILTKKAVDLLRAELRSQGKNIYSLVEEIKESKKEIEASLEEKHTLLKEIHHRVKNNLQIISSLINLQSFTASKENLETVFSDLKSRIKSMALIHEKLYQSNDFSFIDFADFAIDLSNQLFRTYNVNPEFIQLKTEIENIKLPLDSSISLGLILNELVTNSLKHAFPEKMKGEIKITLKKAENNSIILSVKDNGIGIEQNLNLNTSDTLGLKLISSLINQLNAKLDVKKDGGSEFIVTMDANKNSKIFLSKRL